MNKIIYIILTLVLASCTKANEIDFNYELYQKEEIQKLEKKLEAPAFTLKNISGKGISLSDYKGKVVFLNFWASWCPPCISEMPSIERLHKATENLDIEVITINVGENSKNVGTFMKNGNYSFDVLLDNDNTISNLYSIRNIPTSYIIDKEGFVVAFKVGAHEWDNEAVIEILKNLTK